MEHKLFSLEAAEVKFSADKPGFFAGYASKFHGIDAYGDTILPGAYAKTLEGRTRPVQMRWNHRGPVIGKFTTIKEDGVGLYVEGELTPGHSVAEDARASMKHGAVTGLSIGYYVTGESWNEKDRIRTLTAVDLEETSLVTFPANDSARVESVKSRIVRGDVLSLTEFEGFLREAGFSKSQATAIAGRGYKHLMERSESDPASVPSLLQSLQSLRF